MFGTSKYSLDTSKKSGRILPILWPSVRFCLVRSTSDIKNWIPDCPPEKVSTIAPVPVGTTVDMLLDQESGTWDEEVVQSLLEEEIASKII
jgi:hypothetical protein